MNFKYITTGISSGALRIVVMDDEDAFELGAKPGDRIRVYKNLGSGQREEPGIIAILDVFTGEKYIERGTIGLNNELHEKLNLTDKDTEIEIFLSQKPKSFQAIRNKVKGKELTTQEINDIIYDCTNDNLLDIEKAAFIVGLQVNSASDREVEDLAFAMANSGEVLDFGPDVYDKHSTGGVPGNKVSLIIVPIISASGLFIPKTSTRAITSPSGTADSMEVLAKVAFTKDKVLQLLQEERCGILWGGALDSAPADNSLIRIEKPLSTDPFPLMIASILCKKMAMGVKKMVLDIPCGKGTKFPTVADGRKYATWFKEIAKRVGIKVICLLTNASQPIGHAVGPALEAREAIRLLREPSLGPSSLRNKSCELAGILLEMAGKAPEGEGKKVALQILNSGDAYKAMKKMIKAQEGNPEITPEEIKVGPFMEEMKALVDGVVTAVENKYINRIAKIAGCPGAKKAGIEIEAKIGEQIKKGEVIFRIYSDSENRLKRAVEYYNAHKPQILGGMTIERI
ncbi:MAG: AMP phosphorylase [Promethearchaeota archaeon]